MSATRVALDWLCYSTAVILALFTTLLLVRIWLFFNVLYFYHGEHCVPFQFFLLPAEVGMGIGSELWAEVTQV